MRTRLAVLLAVTLAGSSATLPSYAGKTTADSNTGSHRAVVSRSTPGGDVTSSYWYRAARAGDDYLVVWGCDASATSGSGTTVPIATTVSCSVNGVAAVAVPGRGAAIGATATTAPVTLCWSVQVTFLDLATLTSYTVSAGPNCTQLVAER